MEKNKTKQRNGWGPKGDLRSEDVTMDARFCKLIFKVKELSIADSLRT